MSVSRKTAFQYLQRAHEQGRLAHAYLFSGPPGSGKRALAADLARLIHGAGAADIFAPGTAGLSLIEPESKSRRIVIEQVRELEHSLQMRAVDGRRKLAIIAEADRLQPQAANAFLKTLEEPPKDSLLLLLSALPELLPDTVRSRCIHIPLAAELSAEPTEEEAELIELLRAVAREEKGGVETAYRLTQGCQRLLARMREQIQAANAAALKADEARYRNTTDGSWLDEREDYYKALNESLYLERRSRLVETLFLWWSDVLRAATGVAQRALPDAKAETAAQARQLSSAEILRRLQRLEELRDHLGRNIQEALALEVAFLRLAA
jgi:DNA polymerase-3 subunit delta'